MDVEMNKKSKMLSLPGLVGGVLILLLIVGCGGPSQALLDEKDMELEQLRSELDALDKRLSSERQKVQELTTERDQLSETVDVERQRSQAFKAEVDRIRKEGFVIENRILLPNAILFRSASATLSDRGKLYIDEIWETLSKHADREILIEGHSDNMPIGSRLKAKYPSNWELSAARALAVLHYIEAKNSIAPSNLGIVGYGEYRPRSADDSREGRAQNRRVEIVIGDVKGDD